MGGNGIVAAGHPLTAEAAIEVLQAGGNAFDAILAAHFTACVAEPVLASLGGGGFLLARPASGRPGIYDFFAQTPLHKRPADELDFRPIVADFGTAKQEFHIGLGTIAAPGSVRGVFSIHRDLCTMPMGEITAHAVAHARSGVALNHLQAYIFSIVRPIYMATPEAGVVFESEGSPGLLKREGEVITQTALADTLEILAIEGADLFYRGEIAQRIAQACRTGGGHLTREDLEAYTVALREPLALDYRSARIWLNPPPSSGGLLLALALTLLERYDPRRWGFGDFRYLMLLAEVMVQTNRARVEAASGSSRHSPDETLLLAPEFLARYRAEVAGRAQALRGTTHISVMDADDNVATMTVSNGEGCGAMIEGTGIMLNNMLGEDDLNPLGFHRWRPGERLTSMMCPTLVLGRDGSLTATGSGGSNRIRSALLQVLVNLIDFGMDVEQAVRAPRIHLEEERLSIEGGFDAGVVRRLAEQYPDHEVWDDLNLFFGGAHTVQCGSGYCRGCGDPRRGGRCLTA